MTENFKNNKEIEIKEIEIAERITIEYANLSGRESVNRAEFRNKVRGYLLLYRNFILKKVKNK